MVWLNASAVKLKFSTGEGGGSSDVEEIVIVQKDYNILFFQIYISNE